jgi:hypothetical protein
MLSVQIVLWRRLIPRSIRYTPGSSLYLRHKITTEHMNDPRKSPERHADDMAVARTIMNLLNRHW